MRKPCSYSLVLCLTHLAAIGGLTAPVFSQPVVSFAMHSPQHAQTLSPGETVEWSITVSATQADNFGLALACCDLVADPQNPAFFDIPAADEGSLPPAMLNFDRPAGITNPGENGAISGFVGVQRGIAGQRNLLQIGGGQNTAGQALPSGTGCGESAAIDQGVGQDAEPQILATGTFTAPSTPGTYTFHLSQGLANVLSVVSTPPEPAVVIPADVDLSAGSISFLVSSDQIPGDLNCDGQLDMADVGAFVLALTDPVAYSATYACDASRADLNSDGVQDGEDIQAFVTFLCSAPR